MDGLEHYLKGQYDDAIHLWTRVLFIDRHHARARAYISRARGALGERQRQLDEALDDIDRLLDAARFDEARLVLAEIGRTTGAEEQVAERWARLDRLVRVQPSQEPHATRLTVVDIGMPVGRPYARWAMQLLAAGAVALLIITLIDSPVIGDWLSGSAEPPMGVEPAPPPMEVLSTPEVGLIRARNLFARGRLSEAMAALETIEGSVEAESLRSEIQQMLLQRIPLERRDEP